MSYMREAFEREAERIGYNVRRGSGGLYFYGDTQMAWELWQAARTQGDVEPVGVAWDDPAVDPIVSNLYRKFKEWNQREFTADDVTWCEVRGYVAELLNTRPPSAGVPEGWKLVPIEPTGHMLKHGTLARTLGNGGSDKVYKAMIDAAPQPPREGE